MNRLIGKAAFDICQVLVVCVTHDEGGVIGGGYSTVTYRANNTWHMELFLCNVSSFHSTVSQPQECIWALDGLSYL